MQKFLPPLALLFLFKKLLGIVNAGGGGLFLKENVPRPLLRCPKFFMLALARKNFDRGHSSRSLLPPPAAVALVPLHPHPLKEL